MWRQAQKEKNKNQLLRRVECDVQVQFYFNKALITYETKIKSLGIAHGSVMEIEQIESDKLPLLQLSSYYEDESFSNIEEFGSKSIFTLV